MMVNIHSMYLLEDLTSMKLLNGEEKKKAYSKDMWQRTFEENVTVLCTSDGVGQLNKLKIIRDLLSYESWKTEQMYNEVCELIDRLEPPNA